MSQQQRFGVGVIPPTVPTIFRTENGDAVPAANILLVTGATDATLTPSNDTNGITTKGSGNTESLILTNRLQAGVTTTNATPNATTALNLGATPGVYTFEINVAGFDATDSQGLGYSIFGSVRTTGAAAVLIGTPDKIVNEENSPVDLSACDANLIVTGNTAVVQLTGIAAKTIRWRVLGTFIFVS